MMNVYPIILIRQVEESGELEDRFVSQRTYAHKKDLTEPTFNFRGPKRDIATILGDIARNQPKNIPDSEVEKYFDKQMKKQGFKIAKIARGTTSLNRPYAYKFKD